VLREALTAGLDQLESCARYAHETPAVTSELQALDADSVLAASDVVDSLVELGDAVERLDVEALRALAELDVDVLVGLTRLDHEVLEALTELDVDVLRGLAYLDTEVLEALASLDVEALTAFQRSPASGTC